ncbi:hypothetical protein H4Q26_007430 [Puccinia striiformis f. sp. tritici PST-130]|nr:hypothetical protein H4Q26_007430 [Puccinia striiformis f. sp. tritici PST-130]
MLDFNGDWDEPDIWSTPTPSPLAATHNSTQRETDLAGSEERTLKEPQASASSIQTTLDLSDPSFPPTEEINLDSNSDQEPSTPKTLQSPLPLQSYLQSPERPSDISSDLGIPQDDSNFGSRSLVTDTWSTGDSLANNALFDPNPSSSTSGFDEFDSPRGFDDRQDSVEDDDFGDFDDGGEVTISSGDDDNFGAFTAPKPLTPSLPTMPIVPFKLPEQFSEGTVRAALTPALEALFTDYHSQSDTSQTWLEPLPSVQKKRNEHQRPSPESRQMPSILKSDDLQSTWRTLVDGGNGLGRPVEWKRSQIRRFHLVHLGIPVDLNDFLAPPPLASKLLTIDTRRASPRSNGPSNRQSPATVSPFHGPILDRKRCDELVGMSEVSLATHGLEQLASIRDELELLDCKSYNTMISDLVLAAQKIQMASPGSTKRASSINLGSSSISGASSKWPSLTRRNSNQNNRPHPTSTPQTTSPPPMDHPR